MFVFFRVEAAWKALRERNVVLQDTAEDYTAVLGDSVRKLRKYEVSFLTECVLIISARGRIYNLFFMRGTHLYTLFISCFM